MGEGRPTITSLTAERAATPSQAGEPPAPLFERPVDRDGELRGTPGVVRFLDLPERRFVMVDGDGAPGDAAFAPRMPGLYATAYTIRFALKRRGVTTRVGPLEGLWWVAGEAPDLDEILGAGRDSWHWTLLIALPDEATAEEVETGLAAGRAKLDPVLAPGLRVEPFAEGRVAQILHLGPYATERASIERLHEAATAAGLELRGRHHEVYLGDPRRSAPERLRTILRNPVRGPAIPAPAERDTVVPPAGAGARPDVAGG